MMRIIGGVVVGFLLWTALFLGGNQGIMAIAPEKFNEDQVATAPWLLGVIVTLSVVWSLISGAVAARIAGAGAMKTAVALAAILLAIGVAVQVSYWDKMPLWYHLSFLGLLAPGTLVGAAAGRRRPQPV